MRMSGILTAEGMTEGQERHFCIHWEEVLGHDRQKEEMRRLLSRGKLPHALLLAGPEGIGKRLLGRVLAAAVLCPHQTEGAPCGCCPSSLGQYTRVFFIPFSSRYFDVPPVANRL